MKRTHHCNELRPKHIGQTVSLSGWVHSRRDLGGVIFIDVRDREGRTQAVFDPSHLSAKVFERAAGLRSESVIRVGGAVRQRPDGTVNPKISTGEVEVLVQDLEVLNLADPLPFQIDDPESAAKVNEELRLKYRYLDLRRGDMARNLRLRHAVATATRAYFDEHGFLEIETPMLFKSTPEGAREFLVPCRTNPGLFYALPQSPQQFKQILMVAGIERYFQLAKCFRDEDLRPNRQPEFTQLDLEASFIDEEYLYDLVEELTVRMFAVGGITLTRPFARMTHQEAMDFYGTDRPDTRFGLRFVEATDLFADTRYGIFRQILQRGGRIKGIKVPGQSEKLSKNVLQNEYAKEIVPSFGAKGMTWMRVTDGELDSNIVQFFSESEQRAVLERFGAQNGDVLLMIADASYPLVLSALGQLRLHLAERLGLAGRNRFSPLWVTDFPLFEATEEGVTSNHHPFTAPDRADFDPADREGLLALRSRAYDLVVNGEELGGGSIRINDKTMQHRIFQALGLSEEEIEAKFGFFVRALDYGAPPHGGLALGMDRVVSMILGTSSIREVTAFPKNRSAYCPLTQAPSQVATEQLDELGLLEGTQKETIPGVQEQKELIDVLSWVSRIGLEAGERPAIVAALAGAMRLAELSEDRAGDEAPLFAPHPAANRMRAKAPARVSPLAVTGEVLKNAPSVKGNYFKVASILE